LSVDSAHPKNKELIIISPCMPVRTPPYGHFFFYI